MRAATIIASVMGLRAVRDPRTRRLALAAAAVILAVLSIWPRQYLAKAELLPKDPGGGLSAILSGGANGGLLSLGALIGQRQSIEAELAVSRSHAVAADVVRRLRLTHRPGFGDADHAEARLRAKVRLEALRGSILLVSVRDTDRAFALALAGGYAAAVQDRLAALNLTQTAAKRAVAENRLSDATIRLARAQQTLARFRETNKLAAPEAQLSSAVVQLAALQGRLQAKEVDLSTLSQFATNQDVRIVALRAEIEGLRAEIAQAQTRSGATAASNLANMAAKDTEYFNLYRDEQFAQVLYQIYTRYLESTTIDELSVGANVDMVDPAYVDPGRQFNAPAEALFCLVLFLAGAAEFYIIRPPVGETVGVG